MFYHLLQKLNSEEKAFLIAKNFLNNHQDKILKVFKQYIKSRLQASSVFSPTSSSAGDDSAIDRVKDMINSNSELKDTLSKIQNSFKILCAFVDDNGVYQVKYAAYEGFKLIAETELEEYASVF